MWSKRQSWIGIVLAGLMASCLGCEPQAAPPKPEGKKPPETQTFKAPEKPAIPAPEAAKAPQPVEVQKQPATQKVEPVEIQKQPAASKAEPPADTSIVVTPPAAAEPVALDPAVLAAIPQVELTDKDAAACLVKVGDAMPDAELPDLAGKTQPLKALYGQKLTVVVFWTAESVYGVAELQDLARDVAGPYAERGVRVVGIDEGDASDVVREKTAAAEVKFPILLDRDGALLAKVAQAKPPRTYLLDATGKILWFDIEYSRSTRRDLMQAVAAIAGKGA